MIRDVERIAGSSGSHYQTPFVDYRAHISCPKCEYEICSVREDDYGIPLFNGQADSEDGLRSALLGCGPWICRSCGIAFGLTHDAIEEVLKVYRKNAMLKRLA